MGSRLVRVRPVLERLRFAALAALGTLLTHDLVFAAQYGLGPARDDVLARTGHAYWPAFVALALLLAAAGGIGAAAAIVRLRRLLRGIPAAPVVGEPGAGRGYLREVARLWPRLLLVVAVAFVLQENVEHRLAGEPAPGLWALSAPGYPLAIPGLVLVTGLLSIVGAALRWHHETLVRRLVAARAARRPRPAARDPHRRWSLVAALVALRWILLRQDAGRAPPVPAAA